MIIRYKDDFVDWYYWIQLAYKTIYNENICDYEQKTYNIFCHLIV